MDVGFLGLGAMGRPMASNLAAAGHRVVAWNRSPVDPIANVELTVSPAAVAEATHAAIVMVSDESAVRSVVFGPHGWAEGAKPGDVVVLSSTVGPAAARGIAEELAGAGFRMIDAPVSGSVGPAAQGALVVLAGGNPELLDELDPLFAPLASRVVRLGSVGTGSAVKLAVNAILTSVLAAAGEALTWLSETEPEVQVADLAPVLERLSPLVAKRVDALIAEPSIGGFSVLHAAKDLALAMEAMRPADVLQAVAKLTDDAVREGLADYDVAALGSAARARRAR
jgi:3-hydroxyisobutyrate dehydrogenase